MISIHLLEDELRLEANAHHYSALFTLFILPPPYLRTRTHTSGTRNAKGLVGSLLEMVALDIRELGEDPLEGDDTPRGQRRDRRFFV